MKKLFLLLVGLVMAQFATAQTIVVLELPNPCSNIGVDEVSAPDPLIAFDVFPNPVDEYAHFTVDARDHELGKIVVELSDLRGRTVRKMEFYSAHSVLKSRFETGMLEAGVYIVTLRCEVGVISKKMIKR